MINDEQSDGVRLCLLFSFLSLVADKFTLHDKDSHLKFENSEQQ